MDIFPLSELETWPRPAHSTIKTEWHQRYDNATAALTSLLTGEMGLTRAAEANHLCRKRLKSMLRRSLKLSSDGEREGFRVCVPWGAYHRDEDDVPDAVMPRNAGPHALAMVLVCHPPLRDLVQGYPHPLPPGRPPKSFDRLHDKAVAYLRKNDLGDYYPLNQPDKGRRALLRYIRQRRIDTAPAPVVDDAGEPSAVLKDMIRGRLYSRAETDAHRIDIEAVLGVTTLNGGVVRRPITTMWLLCEIETESRAILGWALRVGRGYNNLDLSTCVATSLCPWVRRELTIPDLAYHPGAGMPAGLDGELGARRVRSIALDNAKAHHSMDFESAFCSAHGGILVYGRAHEPRSRPIVEQLFSRLEQGAFREVPGGFEPATRLGDDKIRISNFAPNDFPIQLHLFEELLDVIIANYNASPHPALGNLSPLQFLQMHKPRGFDFTPSTAGKDAVEMASTLVPLKVQGNRKTGVLPFVHYMYARYRSPDLDGKWELIGQTIYARVDRHDLRTLLLMRSTTKSLGVVRAGSPWDKRRHDETTRALIMQWTKQPGGFSLVGVTCAIDAYVNHLRKIAPTTPKAVDQIARMQQHDPHHLAPAPHQLMQTPVQMPRRGWVSFDDVRDH
jgi:transposase InsO family protein